jgi:hypothetical protein
MTGNIAPVCSSIIALAQANGVGEIRLLFVIGNIGRRRTASMNMTLAVIVDQPGRSGMT